MSDMTGAKLIRELRQRAYLTQTELAARSGTSQPALARLESGTGSPTLATLTRLAEAAGYGIELQLVERSPDRLIEAYGSGVDRTLLRRNLALSVDQRIRELAKLQEFDAEIRGAMKKRRGARG